MNTDLIANFAQFITTQAEYPRKLNYQNQPKRNKGMWETKRHEMRQ